MKTRIFSPNEKISAQSYTSFIFLCSFHYIKRRQKTEKFENDIFTIVFVFFSRSAVSDCVEYAHLILQNIK